MKPLFWIAVNLIGFFVLTFMYIDTRQLRTAGRAQKRNNIGQEIFKYLQIALMLFLIFDTGMYMTDGISSHARTIHYIFSLLFYLFTPLPGFVFFLYCDYKIFNDEKGLLKRLPFYSLPIAANTIAAALTPFTGLLFTINEHNVYARGDFIWITIIAGFGYLAAHPLLNIFNKKNQMQSPKETDIYLYLFPVPPLMSAVIQLLYYGPLLLGISFVISAYFLYTNNIQSTEDKRRLSVRFNNINIAHFGLISFIMVSVMLWTIENTINELSQDFYDINQLKLTLPFIITIVLFIIAVFSMNRIAQRMIFMPLKHLVDSLLHLKELYGLERDDEIGLLANTIHELFIKGNYDGLTGIYNRQYMESTMQQLMTALSRTDALLSVLIIDVDKFKSYNDTYGHIKGDECLKIIAKTLNNKIIRKGDFTARYGGEEFAVVLPGTNGVGAMIMAERMLDAVRELKIPHQGINGYVTISIGITTGDRIYTQNWNDFFIKADEALYMSKNGGRNRCTFLSLNSPIHQET